MGSFCFADRSSFPLHNCSKSTSCLQSALKFILNQGGECKILHDLVCLMFDYIPEREVLEGFNILKEFNASEEKKLLKENVQKHVFANIKKIMTGKVKSSDSKAINGIISKAEGELRIALVFHCEMEIVSQIKNPDGFRYGFMCKDRSFISLTTSKSDVRCLLFFFKICIETDYAAYNILKPFC